MLRFKRIAMCLAVLGCLATTTAWAQAVKVFDFSCTSTPLGVTFDVRGLGGTNLCVVGTATVNLSCACAGGGGNCTSDAKKATGSTTISSGQSFEPKNGRVSTSFSLSPSLSDTNCTDIGLQCGSGQDEKLVKFSTQDSQPTFTICTTTAAPGETCSCAGAPTVGDLPQSVNCGPVSGTPFAGKHNSCSSLFP